MKNYSKAACPKPGYTGKAVRFVLPLALLILGLGVVGGLAQQQKSQSKPDTLMGFGLPIPMEFRAAAMQSCTPQTLLDSSNCDKSWDNYKDGYRACVTDMAKHWWREKACSDEALTKLQYSCRDCERRYRK
ncbi:MAG TPA: hypothetical protein VI636_04025 [Candidatus Angelobacter sp.]